MVNAFLFDKPAYRFAVVLPECPAKMYRMYASLTCEVLIGMFLQKLALEFFDNPVQPKRRDRLDTRIRLGRVTQYFEDQPLRNQFGALRPVPEFVA